ncbi:hypothetical protein D9O50_07280 [Oxalobacteraceae bacterium CAVE-383]|nr:hypothetical protein D9O50_07280 [Oxalobacteraceae bacterium CAVE-383]
MKRIFVLNDVAADFDQDFNTPFETKMNDIANSCQVQLMFYHSSALSLQDNSLEEMKTFGADGVMIIKHEYGTKSATLTWEATYDARVVDADSKKVIWRAKTTFKRTGTLYQALNKQAEAFAIRITNKLKEDKVFVGCPLIADQAEGAAKP